MVVDPLPFPHLVVDDWFDRDLLDAVAAEIDAVPPDSPRWKRYSNGREVKFEGGPVLWGDAARSYFAALAGRTRDLEDLFGIPELSMETIGGGFHLIPPGGLLAMHADFNRSPASRLFRRLNVLTYLNADWTDPGGHLILGGDTSTADITPEMGRTAAFATSSTSWHGHPVPARRWRKSIAAYFFSPHPPADYRGDQSTVWQG